MATILDQYLEKQNTIRSQIAENSLPPEDLLIMQELNYRICVLETFQSFCKSAPITLDTKVMGYHFQMVDAYVRFTLNERRFGLKADAEGQKRRETALSSFEHVVQSKYQSIYPYNSASLDAVSEHIYQFIRRLQL